MSRETPVWGVTVHTPPAAHDLFPGARQVRAFARARSRAAFARALIAAGLESRSEAAVTRYLADYGSQTWNPQELATAQTEGQVYLLRPHDRDAQAWPWPPA